MNRLYGSWLEDANTIRKKAKKNKMPKKLLIRLKLMLELDPLDKKGEVKSILKQFSHHPGMGKENDCLDINRIKGNPETQLAQLLLNFPEIPSWAYYNAIREVGEKIKSDWYDYENDANYKHQKSMGLSQTAIAVAAAVIVLFGLGLCLKGCGTGMKHPTTKKEQRK